MSVRSTMVDVNICVKINKVHINVLVEKDSSLMGMDELAQVNISPNTADDEL